MTKQLRSYRFDDRSLALIEQLKQELNLDNNSAVLRKAITLLKMAADASKTGGSIVLRTSDGEKEIVLC
jgi:hypothetical protein